MSEHIAVVRFLPVCSCGYIFGDEFCIGEEINKHEDIVMCKTYFTKTNFIEPPFCPNCKRKIDHVEWHDHMKYIKR